MKHGEITGLARAAFSASLARATSELEAAEALAGLARCECDRQRGTEDPAICIRQYSGYTADMVTVPRNRELTVKTMPSQLCGKSNRSNSASKLRQNSKDVEKEAKKLRRILANRESARQTIRRREAIYLELTRKASDLLEENENLKKKKENAVREYTSLKGRNEFLKAQMSKMKDTEPSEMQEEPNSSRVEMSSSSPPGATVYLYNQPSIVPVFWPQFFPSSDVIQYQCASHPEVMSSHQGEENSSEILRPLFVLPVPWLLPFLNQSSTLHSHSGMNDRENATQSTNPRKICPSSDDLLHEENNHFLPNQNIRVGTSNHASTASARDGLEPRFSRSRRNGGRHAGHCPKDTVEVPGTLSALRPVERLRHPGNSLVNDNRDVHNVFASDTMMKSYPWKSCESLMCPPKKLEDALAAAKARRRRKELMKLKSVHYHHVRTHY